MDIVNGFHVVVHVIHDIEGPIYLKSFITHIRLAASI